MSLATQKCNDAGEKALNGPLLALQVTPDTLASSLEQERVLLGNESEREKQQQLKSWVRSSREELAGKHQDAFGRESFLQAVFRDAWDGFSYCMAPPSMDGVKLNIISLTGYAFRWTAFITLGVVGSVVILSGICTLIVGLSIILVKNYLCSVPRPPQ